MIKKQIKLKSSVSYIVSAWSSEDLEYLYYSKTQGVPYSVISIELNRSVESCKSKWLKNDWSKSGLIDAIHERTIKVKKSAYEQKQISTVENRLDMFRMRGDIIADRMEKSIIRLPKIKKIIWNPNRSKKKRGEEEV